MKKKITGLFFFLLSILLNIIPYKAENESLKSHKLEKEKKCLNKETGIKCFLFFFFNNFKHTFIKWESRKNNKKVRRIPIP